MGLRLDSLSQLPTPKSGEDSPDARAKAAEGLTAMLMRQLLSEMHRGQKGGMLDGGYAGGVFRDMLDQALSEKMAQGDQLNLSSLLDQQLQRLPGRPNHQASAPTLHPSTRQSGAQALAQYSKQVAEITGETLVGGKNSISVKDPRKPVEDMAKGGR